MEPVLRISLLVLMLEYGGVGGLAQKTNTDTLLDSDEVCGSSHQWEYNYTVYVDPSIDHKDCDLKTATEGKQNVTCPNISVALEHNHRNSTAFVLASGPNVTHVLKPGNQSFLQELTDVGFFGESSSNLARVVCEDGAGLAFWNVDRIRLQNVEFSFCGALRNTTSKNFTKDARMKVKAGLYFYNGNDVTMCHVTVQHGPDSLGVLMYDTDGTVNVYHSSFINNTVPDNGNNTGGGGFYVEFSYYVPGDEHRHQLTHLSNSSYVFYNCTFISNSATMRNVVRLVTRYHDHIGFGRGGGLAVYIINNATRNRFQILDCLFEGNGAFFGGGLYLSFKNTSIGNTVLIDKTNFNNNKCDTAFGNGGALRVYSALNFRSKSLIDRDVKGNSVTVTASNFTENQALQGGAIAFSPTYQTSLVKEQTTYLNITNSIFSVNHAQLGAAIHAELNPFFVFGTINDVNIKDCIFNNNGINLQMNNSNHDMGIGTVYTSQVPLNFSSSVEFRDNSGSALALTGTYANFFDTTATFFGNNGDTGGAIAFLGSAYAIVNESTRMHFTNNSARKGGAIYNVITGRGAVQSSRACFILYSDPFKERNQWNASFTFENNTSINNTSNSIYTTSAYPCAIGDTGVKKNLTETLLFCNNSNWKFVNSTCIDEIQTEGNSYSFTIMSTISSFPGKGFVLPVQVLDDLSHNITDFTSYTSTMSPDQQAWVDPRFSQTSDNYVSIVGQQNTAVTLELQSTGLRPHYFQMEVELLKCPPGLHFEANKCTCNPTLSFGKNLNCSSSLIHFEANIPWNFWIGRLDQHNDKLLMGEIPNLYSEQEFEMDYYRVLPESYDELDKVVCGNKSRTGTLCGKCIANYSTSVNSNDYICTPCDDDKGFVKNVFIFIALSYLPYIFLFGVVVYFKNLKLTSSATNGFILYAQMISLDIFDINGSSRLHSLHISRLRKAYHFVYGIFNFNSFASVMDPFCIHKNWTTLDVLLLEYTLAGLPILLILFLYLILRFKSIKFLCCKSRTLSIQASPRTNSRRNNVKEKSFIHILVACILLSYTKITVVSMKILAVQKLFDQDGRYQSSDPRVYFAGHLSFFSKEYFLPYGAIAVLLILIFVVIPPLFLLGLPQLIDRILDTGKFPCLKRLWPTVTINIFLDAFQGFYKRELYCRIFAGLYFVFRLVIVILYVVTSNYLITYFWQQFFIAVMILLLSIFQPYKKRVFNILDTLIFFNLAVVNMISEYVYTSSLTVSGLTASVKTLIYMLQYILIWLPLVYMLSYVGYKILAKLGIIQRLRIRIRRERQQAVYFDPSASESWQSARSESEDEEDRQSSESRSLLSDSALFSRAKATNQYCPPGGRQCNPTGDVNKHGARAGTVSESKAESSSNINQQLITY